MIYRKAIGRFAVEHNPSYPPARGIQVYLPDSQVLIIIGRWRIEMPRFITSSQRSARGKVAKRH